MPTDAKPPAPSVLAVDDDHRARRVLAIQLLELGCEVEQARTRPEALDLVRCRRFTLAICDLASAGPGLDLLSQLLEVQPDLPVVVIARDPSPETVAEAMKRGAKECLPKPLDAAQVCRLVTDAYERASRLAADRTDEVIDRVVPRAAQDLLRRAATCDFPVLIRGEHGTGKGALARAIHERGVRSGGPFQVAIAREAPDAEHLLGLSSSDGGSLLVEEVGDLSRALQEALLRRLRESARSSSSPSAGVRVLATTSCDLAAKAREGTFLVELLRELRVIEFELPPLRDRPFEILPLAEALVAEIAERRGVAAPAFDIAARRLLVTWAWPGNVRELSDGLERAMSERIGDVLGTEAFPEWMKARADEAPMAGAFLTLQQLEREHVTRVVAWASTLDEAARVLGMDSSAVRRKLRSWEGRAWHEGTSRPVDLSPSRGTG
jgi:NtrC-family two-component system response regulator AlgB